MLSNSFIGFVPNNEAGNSFVSDCRKLLRGTGVGLRVRGRNPNRKQFYTKTGYGKHPYCQDLPVKYASHYALYVRDERINSIDDYARLCERAKIVIDTISKIYQLNNIKLNIQ